jgi:hypothetical protein
MRVLTGSQPSAVARWTTSLAGSLVSPVPRRLGRDCSGRRLTSSRSPPRLTSSSTSVRTSQPAWSLRSRRSSPRAPGTVP